MTQGKEKPKDGDVEEPLFGDEAGREASRAGFVPEFVRKVAVAGLGALFMTEEGIRSLAGQLKLPKEVLGYILGQAEKTKDEVGRVISEELRRFLQSDKLRDDFIKLLSGMTVEVKAQIRLVPPDKAQAESEGESAAPGGNVQVNVTEVHTRRGGKRARKE